MIDSQGFRPNVGIVLVNQQNLVFWGKRQGQDAWQFPQGGLNENESPEDAMYRELYEEVGLKPEQVSVLGQTKSWLRYRLPKRLIRFESKPVCIGQKQCWYLLRLETDDKEIALEISKSPEFDSWQWVTYWFPLRQVVSFKREVYRRAMKELSTLLFNSTVRKDNILDPLISPFSNLDQD